jgi:hypothetical protein
VAELIERRFEVTYTLRGVSYLLHRICYSQRPGQRRLVEAVERIAADVFQEPNHVVLDQRHATGCMRSRPPHRIAPSRRQMSVDGSALGVLRWDSMGSCRTAAVMRMLVLAPLLAATYVRLGTPDALRDGAG